MTEMIYPFDMLDFYERDHHPEISSGLSTSQGIFCCETE